MKLDERTGIVLISAGEPRTIDDVEPWLGRLLADRRRTPLPWYRAPWRRAWARVRAHQLAPDLSANHARIGVDQPLLRVTAGQADGIAARLNTEGYLALFDGHPDPSETVALMRSEGMTRAVAVSGTAEHCPFGSSFGLDAFRQAWVAAGGRAADVLIVRGWSDDNAYHSVLARGIRETLDLLNGDRPHLLFIARGIPHRLDRADPRYREDIETVRRRVMEILGDDLEHSLSYQPPLNGEVGLEPIDLATAKNLVSSGVRDLMLIPLGVIADRYETLFGIDLRLARALGAGGLRLYRVPTPNDREDLLEAIAGIVRRSAETRFRGAAS